MDKFWDSFEKQAVSLGKRLVNPARSMFQKATSTIKPAIQQGGKTVKQIASQTTKSPAQLSSFAKKTSLSGVPKRKPYGLIS